jgi:four helix bundle protein
MPLNPLRLIVLDKAITLAAATHAFAKRITSTRWRDTPGLRAQILRAADSIPLNIAEAAGQSSDARIVQQLAVAIGSCNELEAALRIVAISAPSATNDTLRADISEVRRMLFGLSRHIRDRST